MTRPFQPLKHSRGPQSSYDAVVIGAGIGGLISANLLAKSGLKVLLVEQHYMVGGYCSTFQRRGFTFDAASHFYPLLGDPKSMTGQLLVDLGIETEWLKMDPVDQFHLPDGSCFSVPADFDTYLGQLKREFPDETDSLERFFALAQKLYLYGVLYYFRGTYTHRLDQYIDMTLRDALEQFFQSRRLKLLLTADTPHWGSPPNRTSFVFDSMLRMSYFRGNFYPRGGSQRFADELAQRFQERGGDILLKSMVRRIKVNRNRATGVELEIGPRRQRRQVTVEAGAILSNADMRLTIEELIGPDQFDSQYLTEISRMRATYPCFLSHLGVRQVPESVLEQVHGYYWSGWDSDRVAKGDFDCKVFVPTLYEPAMAPPDGHVIIIQKVTDIDYNEMSDWSAHKRSVEEFLLRKMDGLISGFRDKIDVCCSATAQTSNRFTLNYQGAMLGWEMSPLQLGKYRPDIQCPITNFYFVGQWTRPGGGITPVIVSAIQAAEQITGSLVTNDRLADGSVDDEPDVAASLKRVNGSAHVIARMNGW